VEGTRGLAHTALFAANKVGSIAPPPAPPRLDSFDRHQRRACQVHLGNLRGCAYGSKQRSRYKTVVQNESISHLTLPPSPQPSSPLSVRLALRAALISTTFFANHRYASTWTVTANPRSRLPRAQLWKTPARPLRSTWATMTVLYPHRTPAPGRLAIIRSSALESSSPESSLSTLLKTSSKRYPLLPPFQPILLPTF